jgi:hypothetical protein
MQWYTYLKENVSTLNKKYVNTEPASSLRQLCLNFSHAVADRKPSMTFLWLDIYIQTNKYTNLMLWGHGALVSQRERHERFEQIKNEK